MQFLENQTRLHLQQAKKNSSSSAGMESWTADVWGVWTLTGSEQQHNPSFTAHMYWTYWWSCIFCVWMKMCTSWFLSSCVIIHETVKYTVPPTAYPLNQQIPDLFGLIFKHVTHKVITTYSSWFSEHILFKREKKVLMIEASVFTIKSNSHRRS